MLARVFSAAVWGVDAFAVEVEVNATYGKAVTVVVGLPDTAVKESRDRVSTAVNNSAFKYPYGRVTINLAPADVKKEGPSFDLPMALGILVAGEQLHALRLEDYWVVGELALTGEVRPVKGALAIALAARKNKKRGLILPAAMAAAAVEPEIAICEANRARRLGHTGKGAYGLVLKATSCMYRMDHDSFLEGGRLIEEAIEAEPYYGAAHAWLALWNVFLVGQGWAREPAHSIAGAELAAERAILLDPGDARGLAVAGHVQAYLYRRLDTAISIHERAVTVNPNLPIAWQLGGVAHAYAGNLAEAGQFLERSRRLAPCDPHTFFQDGCCVILQLISGKFEEARATGRRVTQLHPRFSASFKPYLAALGHLGDTVAAAEVYRKLLVLEPHFSLSTFEASAPFAQADHMDIYLSGLRLAGVT